jgi:predicted nucleic-acid-binding protein
MSFVVDTNVLLRYYLGDDLRQQEAATSTLEGAEPVIITNETVLEFAWVLLRGYKIPRLQVAQAVRSLLYIETVKLDELALDAGLAFLEVGGDFADGLIAYEGRKQGGETFISFDRKAVRLLEQQGYLARLLT